MLKKTNLLVVVLLSLFLLLSSSKIALAIDLANTSAIQEIGQPDLSTNTSNANGLWYPMDLTTDGTKLFIGEYGCRVSVYNTPPTANFVAKDYVIGEPDKSFGCEGTLLSPTSRAVWDAMSVATDGVHFFVVDSQDNRVLIYDSIPTSSNQAADVVLGQPDMTSNADNNGGLSASSLSGPYGISVYGTKLIVTDTGNNRVLIWNTIPTTNNKPADIVVGQPDMTHNTANNGGITASRLQTPISTEVFNSKLYVADTYNHRVLIFNTFPSANSPSADLVLGQPDMSHNTANNGSLSAHSLNKPSYIFLDNGKLFISDRANNRVLIWNADITLNNQNADVVIGQPDMLNNAADNGGITNKSFDIPRGILVLNSKLYVADDNNNRVLVWNTIPTTNQTAADVVIGHTNFSASSFSDGGPGALGSGADPIFYQGKMIVLDSNNNRVLIWNNIPGSSQYPILPDVVLGQPDLLSNSQNNGGITAHSFYYPNLGAVCNGKLVISDYMNSRILIWNTIPTTNQKDADVVLGQPDMTHNATNNGGLSAHSLYLQKQVSCTDTKLFVADYPNNRVLIWNTIPTTNQKDADVVLGQPDMTHKTGNNGGISAHSLNSPLGVVSDGTRLYISDSGNNRVLVFNNIPTSNFANSDYVIGQADLQSGVSENGVISSKRISMPMGLSTDGKNLFISDTGNSRIIGWSIPITSNFQPADFVIGQPDFTSLNYFVTATSLYSPTSSAVSGNKIYVSDSGNSRIMVYPFGPQSPTVSIPTAVNTETIKLDLSAVGAKGMKVSTTDPTMESTAWVPYTGTASATLSGSEGPKDIYVQYEDYANYTSPVLAAIVTLDQSAPIDDDFFINNGESSTTSRMVTLNIEAEDKYSTVTNMMFSEDPSFNDMSWGSYATSTSFTLSDGWGKKTVYIRYKDAAGNVSGNFSDSIDYVPVTSSPATCNNSVSLGTPNLFQIKTTKNGATLSFTPPAMPYSNFYIAYSKNLKTWDYGVQFDQGNPSSGVISYTINSLSPNTKYYFQIRSGNGCASGKWGNTLSATTGTSNNTKTFQSGTAPIVSKITSITATTPQKKLTTNLKKANEAKITITQTTNSITQTQPNSIPTAAPIKPTTKQKFCILWWCF